jgi:hypothetical protein
LRLRGIQGVSGLEPKAMPFVGLEKFARLIILTPKIEADKENKPAGSPKSGNRRNKK